VGTNQAIGGNYQTIHCKILKSRNLYINYRENRTSPRLSAFKQSAEENTETQENVEKLM
jgi:hypothetical protein